MKVLEIEFYLMHILFKISRRHYCLGGSYGLGRIIYTDEHDGNLRFQCNEVKSLFPVRVGFTRSFWGDGQMELFAFGKFVGHLVYQGSIPAPVYRYGIPVATVAINGAMNAAILAIQMLALSDEKLAEAFAAYKEGLKKKIVKANEELKEVKFEYKTN